MSRFIIYATDKDGEGVPLKVGEYDDLYELYGLRIPVGHFAPDVVLTFEEDSDEIARNHWARKEEADGSNT
jgi:hypothetical protein